MNWCEWKKEEAIVEGHSFFVYLFIPFDVHRRASLITRVTGFQVVMSKLGNVGGTGIVVLSRDSCITPSCPAKTFHQLVLFVTTEYNFFFFLLFTKSVDHLKQATNIFNSQVNKSNLRML